MVKNRRLLTGRDVAPPLFMRCRKEKESNESRAQDNTYEEL